ncbi:hypothetical protein PVK06_031148 [Gossypium arboreum]|uniref:Reverse transcriptase Ty1/copia-type domain-containing protein n=1 Tax=Gossypium arboreum TaxID=29729 RepID=A0ABR0NR87_GOSAR|nr:hypothetical protein PVK06_031148 [Gossypium arboreum]
MSTSVVSVTDNESSRYTRAITTLTMFKVPTAEISAHSRADSSPASDTSALGSSSDCVLSSTSISTLAPIVEQQRPTSVNCHLMITRSKMGIYKRNAYIVMISDVEPSTIHDAMAIPSWKQAINDKLQTLIQNHTADSSLLYKHTNAGSVYFLVYVDDIIVTGGDCVELDVIISCLDRQFSLKDLGELSFFPGLEVLRHQDRMHVSQQKYTCELLKRANMLNAKPVNTPMVISLTLTSLVGSHLSDGTLYRQVLGSLQYLYLTHPDLSFAVNKVS